MKTKKTILCVMAAGVMMLPFTQLPIQATDAVEIKESEFNTDYTKPILSPGANSTELHISWYSKKVTNQQGVMIAKSSEMNGTQFPENAKFYSVTSNKKITLKNGEAYYANKAKVQQLEENTAYMYSYTKGDGKMSEPQEYRTKSFSDYQLMYVGDPQIGASGNAASDVNGWKTTLNEGLKNFPNISYIISVGDQTNASSDTTDGSAKNNFEVEWAGFLEPTQLKNIPVQTLVGNHESKGTNFANHTYVPNESSVGTEAGNDYYYTYGSTLFIVLNTNNGNAADHDAVMKQAVEANPNAKWRVVSFHQDVYGSGEPHSESDGKVIRQWLEPVLDKYDIDVVLTGHDHSYTRSYQLKAGQVQTTNSEDESGRVINPEGTVYMAANSASGSKYYDLMPSAQYYVAKRQQENHQNYSILNIDDVSFSIDTYDVVTGEKIDQNYTIVKSATYEDLQALIGKAESVSATSYTEESMKALSAALSTAKALGKADLNETSIANAYADLNSAFNGLKEKPVTPPTTPSTPDTTPNQPSTDKTPSTSDTTTPNTNTSTGTTTSTTTATKPIVNTGDTTSARWFAGMCAIALASAGGLYTKLNKNKKKK